MKAKALVIFTLCLILAAACSREEAIVSTNRINAAEAGSIIPGIIEVELTEEMAAKIESGQGFTFPGIKSVERIFPDAGEWEDRHRLAGLHRWYRIEYDDSSSITKAAEDMNGMPGITYAGLVRRREVKEFFNDPLFNKQWALYNDGSRGSNYTKGCDINVLPVWERYTSGTPNVIVAILDTGVQLDHPDMADICLPAGPDGSKCFISGNVGYNIQPGSHGTHCAGVVGAINNNGKGVCGIAGGCDGKGGVRIMSCEILREVPNPDDPDKPKTIGGNDSAAFVWAADHGAVIASNSWGFVYDTEKDAASGGPGSAKAGIDYFITYAGCDKDGNQRPDSPMKGGVVIFAAGNESWEHGWPAEYDPVIAVGAVSAKRTRAYYSNFGNWVDICAPGGDVTAGSAIFNCVDNSDYSEMQGTSMACPHVAGVAALLASHLGGQGFTNEMLIDRLLKGANPDGAPKNGNIGPMLDAMGSFSLGSTIAPDKVSGYEGLNSHSNFIDISWKVTKDDDDIKAYSYLVLASQNKEDLESINPANIPSSIISQTVEVERADVGETINCTIEVPEFQSWYYIAIIGQDYWRNYSDISDIISIQTGENHAPVISTEYHGNYVMKSHESLTVEFSVSDPDGHPYTTDMEPVTAEALSVSPMENGLRLVFSALTGEPGKYSVILSATDKYGLKTEYPVFYEILPNHAPVVIKQLNNLIFNSIAETTTINLQEVFTDEDEENLKYDAVFSIEGVAHIFPDGNKAQITALDYGLTEATITAIDAREETCTAQFKILVQDSSRKVTLYPNPVKSILNIRPGQDGKLSVSMANKAGAKVYSITSDTSPFEPVVIDMTSMPAGTYYVQLEGCGINGCYTIVKI